MKISRERARMTFLEAYALHGPDVERIAEAMGITPSEADRLINEAMERRHQQRVRRSLRRA
jgi:DNA-directed RNA polymerase specialized sigma24 family protein